MDEANSSNAADRPTLPLAALTDTNAKFLPKKDMTDYRYRLVDKLVHEERQMALALAKIHAPFNPIRRYYELQRSSAHVHSTAHLH